MRRLSVTEYLIAQNQAQTTVTTYAQLGDAFNAIQRVTGRRPDKMLPVTLGYGVYSYDMAKHEYQPIAYIEDQSGGAFTRFSIAYDPDTITALAQY